MRNDLALFAALAALLASAPAPGPARAAVTAEEAARLGGELTPMGAIRAGNVDGSIPAWEGGITELPAGYVRGRPHPDPFADDEPLFTVTAANAEQHAALLSPGQRAMLERYPDSWRLVVYPTRRSASYPPRIYEATIANATTAELGPGGNGVRNAAIGVPFPIPRSGVEVVWNHMMRYRGRSLAQSVVQVVPTSGGSYVPIRVQQDAWFPYAQEGATTGNIDNRLAFFLQVVNAPPRLAGTMLLVHETLNQVAEPRKAWIYNPGQRRVRRAPNVAYDNPATASDGQSTNDSFDMYNGAPDRYEWELVGRRELLVPYNSYRLHSPELEYDDIVMAGHINPDHLRFERHRVWEVVGRLREGTSHIYAERRFFLDEDSWQILVADLKDARDQVWRVQMAFAINYYEEPLVFDTVHAHFDLLNGRYLATGLNNQERTIEEFDADFDESHFSPASLRRFGLR